MSPTVSSPCIKLCILEGEICIGCGRTLPEIAGWGSLNETARKAVMTLLPARLAARRAPGEPAKASSEAARDA